MAAIFAINSPPLSDVLVVGGAVATLIGAAVAIFEYRQRVRAQNAETDVRLAQLFAQLVPIANGRGEAAVIPESVITLLKSHGKGELEGPWTTAPVGMATQAAAISSLGYLGAQYDSLRQPALDALRLLDYMETHPRLDAVRQAALKRIEDNS